MCQTRCAVLSVSGLAMGRTTVLASPSVLVVALRVMKLKLVRHQSAVSTVVVIILPTPAPVLVGSERESFRDSRSKKEFRLPRHAVCLHRRLPRLYFQKLHQNLCLKEALKPKPLYPVDLTSLSLKYLNQ